MLVDIVFLTLFLIDTAVPATPGWGGMNPPRFCVAKRKKENQGKKERFSKQILLKGCHQGQTFFF